MESREAPLDEIVYSSPQLAAQMMGIHENSVLHYFASSPFYDHTSNNAVISAQAQYNEQLGNIISTRVAFEAHLRTMAGLEFMISEAPAEMTPGAGTGVWVIRKQTRRKRPGQEDEIIVHATYFVVGENIYQAPSLANVIGARMVKRLTSKSCLVFLLTFYSFLSSLLLTTLFPLQPPSQTSAQPLVMSICHQRLKTASS
jgi:mediator of RNA polymerase II transcription subunit 6